MKTLRYLFHDRWVLVKWRRDNNPDADLADNIIRCYKLTGWMAEDVRRICSKPSPEE
ncbi:Uncharacterised protein [Klebsiella pneumoniae]|nr:Uncharacterised protein [Klebsiella pneumoniae]